MKLKHAPKSVIEEQLSGHCGSGLFMMMKKDDSVKNLNAKRIDINFDGDDFFNSFEPVKHKSEVNQATNSNKFTTQL